MGEQMRSQAERGEGYLPLVELFRHNLWANLRLLEACADLDEQQLAATATGTYGSIYDTLTHILRSEQGYLRRLSGKQPENPLRREDHPDFDALRLHAQHSGEGLIEIAATISPDDVWQVEWHDDRVLPVTGGMLLTQAITHGTEHRAQVMTILTQQGIEPPDLSAWYYVEEHAAQ